MHRTSARLKVDYYLNPSDVADYSSRKMSDLDRKAENSFITNLQYECQLESRQRQRMMEDAQGWFFINEDKMRAARNFDMRSCKRLDQFGFSRGY